jgi:hypothetical protein
MRTIPLAALLCLLLTAAAPAQTRPQRLWATVNICDTTRTPDEVGVRASMPGTRSGRGRMLMRFRLQWLSTETNTWREFTADAFDSGWQRIGSARARSRQSGWNFPKFELEAGRQVEVRGIVRFQWRRGGRVVRREARRTTSGRRPSIAQPKGYSAATCVVRA